MSFSVIQNLFVVLIDLYGVLVVRCSSRGAVLALVVCHSRKIDEVASGVRRVSGGVTSSRRGERIVNID
ncbi:hypothetical protein TNCV_1238381 [Trichonephila clavipes]|nr:hypothetical protein TNCV_1238381 [Trichonephila clavipes]